MTLNDTDWDRYMADCRERPLVIDAPWPWYSTPLVILAGVVGGAGIGGVTAAAIDWRPPVLGIALLIIGALLWSVYEVGIGSGTACRRRYEKARHAAIYARYRELGIERS